MTNSKATKKALLSSVLVMLVCVTMLIGTTFAWFTDNSSTNVNKIQSGTLDVELEMLDGENWVTAEGKTLDFVKADGSTTILWEPGATYELPQLRVTNKGNLALKYKIVVNGTTGDAKLLEAIEFTVDGVSLDEEFHLSPNTSSEAFTIKGHFKEDAGNEYQGLELDGISITVYATQYTEEYDSHDNQYDKDAEYADATVYKVTPDTVQSVLDTITGNAVVELAEGDYGTLYLRQALETSTRREDLDKSTSYHAYYREFENVTIKAAFGADVTCDGIKVEAGLFFYTSAPASNQDVMGANTGFISYLSLKNIKVEGITFDSATQNAIYLRDNQAPNNIYGSAFYVDGFTVKNCKGTGDVTNTDVHFFHAGSGSNDLTFCGTEDGGKGFNNIVITDCSLTSYYQPICFNNATAVLNGLTVSNNTFTNCDNNHIQVSNKENKGSFTFSNNTIVNMNGRFVRMANAQSDAVIKFENNTVTTPVKYDADGADIAKITGIEGFSVTETGNGWTVVTDEATKWVANGDTTILPEGTY